VSHADIALFFVTAKGGQMERGPLNSFRHHLNLPQAQRCADIARNLIITSRKKSQVQSSKL